MTIALLCTVGHTQQKVAPIRARDAYQRWRSAGRALSGSNAADLRRQAILQKLQLRSAGFTTGAIAGTGWSSLGPLPLPSDASGTGLQDYNWVSGRAAAIAIDPNDSTGNTVFAGGAYGGLWKSVNAGTFSSNPDAAVWTPLIDDQATLAIGAIAVQPQITNPNANNSVVLAGTGETNSSADSYYGLGILRSTNGGQSWTLISQDATGTHSFAGLGFSRIAFSLANPNLVVAGTGSASEGIVEGLESPVGSNRGIYYSTDAGVSWHASTATDSGVIIGPASVSSVVYNAAAGTFYAAIRFHGFYSSSDGVIWTRLATQPGVGLTAAACPAQAVASSGCPIYRGEIAVVPNRAGPSNMGEMYVWHVDANDIDQGIWKTTNGGGSWLQVNDSGITNCGDLLGGCGTGQATDSLSLAAVPNGTATDIYAGATNLYKCTITNAVPNCSGIGNNAFMNLTHVYGCSDIAKVHPGQHGTDFLVSGGTALLYFANDGGLYRALDGFTGLRAGSCGLNNQFDSLNAMLGPMTQFVSLAESSTDPNLIFGGTQENGAPATAFSQSGGNWVNVNAADVGFAAINPSNDNEWFLSTPPNSGSGANLFHCANGANCHSQDFASDPVVDSNSVGGDAGAFDLPFILDPANSGILLVGTCRIWRGSSSGGSFSLLSPDFENGGTGVCTGTETNLIRAIAAGGLVDSNGFSQVAYAGTNGDGPNFSASPAGGHVWVTTNSDSGPAAWADRTAAINPQGFPISAIAIDNSDRSGQTAYAGIMGFHTPHLWKTIDAGASWSDFTSNLPDAPVDSIVVDPGPSPNSGTIYVGTDVGVFASGTGAAIWNEVGPVAGPGFLPNVAVTTLQIFNSSGLKRLRAATFGRGIWEWNLITTPDFQLSVGNNSQTLFPGQSAVYPGTIFAQNGYGSSVNLSCVAGSTAVPQICSANPASTTPLAQGSAFTVTAGGSAADYLFNLQAFGTDPAKITHNFPLALHVIDFTLGAPSPTSVSVAPSMTTAPISLALAGAGAFSGQVTLSCSGLPAGTACQFQPSNVVAPTKSSPVSIALTITTSITSPPGTYQVIISASSPGGATKTQLLILSVDFVPDYILAITNPSLTSHINVAAAFNGTLTSVNGYASPVALSCGSGAPPNCVVSPSMAIPLDTGTPFTVSVSSSVSQAYAFNVNAVGSDGLVVSHSMPVAFTALPSQGFDFTLSMTPSSVSISAGQTATYSLDVAPTSGTFPSAVTFSCSGAPALTTCSFNPAQVAAGSGDSVITVIALTTAPIPATRTSAMWLISAPMAGLFWLRKREARVRRRKRRALIMVMLALVCVSCGGGLQGNGSIVGSGSPGTPVGSYNLSISVATASITHSTQVNLTVTQ
ncbi:MAG TPA: hypothetical protein VGL74_13335 [Terriglobales bacterium]